MHENACSNCREVDDPEVLWSNEMRHQQLLPALRGHLGDLPLRLRDNAAAVYDYMPMAPMTYRELQGELWCHRYYLRKLCSDEFRNHRLLDLLRFRNVRSLFSLLCFGFFVWSFRCLRAKTTACFVG